MLLHLFSFISNIVLNKLNLLYLPAKIEIIAALRNFIFNFFIYIYILLYIKKIYTYSNKKVSGKLIKV